MDYFPMFVDVRGQRCVVVGGGAVAQRKVESLLRAEARVHVVAPNLVAGLAALVAEGRASRRSGTYASNDLADAVLAIAATDDERVNAQVAQDARAQRVPVNVVDRPELSTFIVPALIDRSPVIVAVSSLGAAPVLARTLRGKLEAMLPASYGGLARLCALLRPEVKARLPDVTRRRVFWEAALESRAAELALASELALAERELRALLDLHARGADAQAARGELACVGTGPGDPDLISFRAQRAMLRAELVLHAANVPAAILELCRRDAPRELLGEPWPEALLARLPELRARTQRGERVCVLVAGDGFRSPEGARCVAEANAAGISASAIPAIA